MSVQKLFRLLVLPLMLLSLPAWSQNKSVTGKVTDSKDGKPLAGASVKVKGTTTGTATNSAGSFTLSVTTSATELEVSMIGYSAITVSITGDNLLIGLDPVAGGLNDVIVVGYGTVKKKDLTGAVIAVTAKDFVKGPLTTPEQLIAGKVSGVNVTPNGGAPGSGSRIRIRGGASLNASNDPLIVIDGVPVGNDGIAGSPNPLSLINPNDIESFNILKDASATAIYGNRASNGVIIITTKKGKAGKDLKVSLSSMLSQYVNTSNVDVLSPQEFRSVVETRGDASDVALLGSNNTNWQDQIYRNAFAADNNLSFTGGIKALPYRLSIGYLGQSGILNTGNLKRTSAALNMSPKFLNNNLSVDISLKGTHTESRFADEGAIGSAVAYDPTQPVFSKSTRFGGYYESLQTNGDVYTLSPSNPLGLLDLRDNTSSVNRAIGNIILDYKFHFLPQLRVNVNGGFDVSDGSGENILSPFARGNALPGNQNINGTISPYRSTNRNKLFETYLKYDNDFKSIKSHLDIMGGYAYQDFQFEADSLRFVKNFDGDSVRAGFRPSFNQYTLVSFYGRLNYNYKGKYYLTVNARYDGSSKFQPDNRWGFFPSVALMWKVKEDIFKNSSFVSDLKLRASYGETGQQEGIGFYTYLPIYQISTNTAQYQFGNQYYPTYRPSAYDLRTRWEQTATTNLGIDFGFANNTVTGSAEVFYKKSTDLLNFIFLPAGSNLSNAITTNVGDMEVKGAELTLNFSPFKKGDFTWDFSVNGTYIQREITQLNLFADSSIGQESGGIAGGVGNNIQIRTVGYAPDMFFVYKQVYDANGNPLEGVYEDMNRDGVINTDDKYRFRNPEPNWFIGFSSQINYKKWSLSTVIRANIDNYVYNNVASSLGAYANFNRNEGFLTNMHSSVLESNFQNNQLFSDYYIENASFIRMDNLNIGYNVGEIGKGVNLRMSGVVQNVFTITKYSGLDPEIAGGIDNNFYPRPRVFSIAFNVDF